ncbi:MAG: hypothetical protein DMG16_27310 [Acidobacteria bacterium]|nr:MAG: hypothetical protein DMG16_27310 [Acidobacteriota bacterium]
MSTKNHDGHMVVVHCKAKPNGEKETFFGISKDAVPIIKEVVKWSAIMIGAGLLLAYGLAPEKVSNFFLHLAAR